MRERYRRNFVLPNYTPAKWFECDVFQITEAGYFNEFEIKISRGDFHADAKKLKRIWDWDDAAGHGKNTDVRKHDYFDQPHEHGPRQFWYVTPENLVTADEVPSWAGLIWIIEYDGRFCERNVKSAPSLHRHKIAPGIQEHAQGVCYWRLHSYFAKHSENNQTTKV